MMRRSIVGLALALLIAIMPNTNAAKIAGSSCPKAGATKKVNKQSYICVKKSSKLIWQLKSVPSKTSTTTDSGVFLYELVQEALKNTKSNTEYDDKLNISISPKSAQFNVQSFKTIAEEASRFYQKYFILDREIEIIILFKDEREYFEKAIKNKSESFKETTRTVFADSRSGGVAGISSDGSAYIVIILNSDYAKNPWNPRSLIYHEMVHVFQGVNAGYLVYRIGGYFPCWYGEGLAQLFGYVNDAPLYDKNSVVFTSTRESIKAYWINNFESSSSATTERMENLIINKKIVCEDANLKYNLGSVITEKFILDFGLNGLLKFTQALGEKPANMVFNDVFGIEEDVWLSKNAIPYLLRLMTGNEEKVSGAKASELRAFLQFSNERKAPQERVYKENLSSPNETGVVDHKLVKGNERCMNSGEIARNESGEFHCMIQNGVLRWSKNNPPPSP